jgi:cytochrome c biogenesis protein CcdA/thiol-disulfide isomerase/thioredoxin
MLIFFLAYLGGLLTIFSPCVLPVLPFVFVRSDQPFGRSGLPILLGMAATFTILSSFAVLGGAWLIAFNQYGRYAAMSLFFLLGMALIFPRLAAHLMHPFVIFGARLQQHADRQVYFKRSFLLGVSVGFLWAPCAGPILGLILSGAALNGVNLYSGLLLLIFAAGAVTSLGLALLAGERIYILMKRGLGTEEWVRRGLGVMVVAGVIFITLGWDTRFLSQFTFLNTAGTEQNLIAQLDKNSADIKLAETSVMTSLTGVTQWFNSPPLRLGKLRGKVVLVDFWTYSCINCLRTLPYMKAWNEKYQAQGLVIIGVHTPEFAFEKDLNNVEQAIRELGITYPVAMDNNYDVWNAFSNQYWPAHYLIDANGKIRDQHFGEGAYQETEQMIQSLLKQAHQGAVELDNQWVKVQGNGAMAAATESVRSPETYLGYARQENLLSPEPIKQDMSARYSIPGVLQLNQWGLSGQWQVSAESATLNSSNGAISYRFVGRDLHLVMGSNNHKPVRFRVTLDGVAPKENHGVDTDAQGNGVISEQRLYQLIRQHGKTSVHTFRIEFLDTDAEAFAFTFG